MPYAVGTSVTLRATFGGNVTDLTGAVLAGTTALPLRDATGYGTNDLIVIEAGTEREERLTVAGVSGNTVSVTTALAFGHAVRSPVMELGDPTTVTLKVQDADGVETTYTYALAQVTRDGVGRYSKTITINGSGGSWWHQWVGTGTVVAADEEMFEVKKTEF